MHKSRKLVWEKYPHKTKAFTLVELIIVITILAILSTVAYISFQWYTKDARDWIRMSDIKQIYNWLSIYKTQTEKTLLPDNYINIQSWTTTISYQWYAWAWVLRALRISWWKDPWTKDYYIYTTDVNTKKAQLMTYMETSDKDIQYLSQLKTIKLIPQTEATNTWYYQDKKIYVYWDKIWILTNNKIPLQETTTNTWIDITTLTWNITTYFWWSVYSWWLSTSTWLTLINQINWALNWTLPCSSTTYNWYTITSLQDKQSQKFTRTWAITNWTQTWSVLATCNNWTLSYGIESLQTSCNLNFTLNWNSCDATWTFSLSSTNVTAWTNVTISNNCSISPTSYTSSNTSVATVVWTTITTLTAWTTNITPVWWSCSDSSAKTLTIPPNNCNSTQPANATLTTWSPTSPNQAWQTNDSSVACHFVCNAWYWYNGASCVSATNCTSWLSYITLSNWQSWSCMNLWATSVRDWSTQPTNCWNTSTTNCNPSLTWLWDYYQWGRNDAWWTNWQAWWNYDWQTPQVDNAWWWNSSDTATADWAWTTKAWRKWPCPIGWHVPSVKDWQDMCNNILWTTCSNGMAYNSLIVSKLRLPFAGYRFWNTGYYYDQSIYVDYWSSSPTSYRSYNMESSNSNIWPSNNPVRANGFPIRCIKN